MPIWNPFRRKPKVEPVPVAGGPLRSSDDNRLKPGQIVRFEGGNVPVGVALEDSHDGKPMRVAIGAVLQPPSRGTPLKTNLEPAQVGDLVHGIAIGKEDKDGKPRLVRLLTPATLKHIGSNGPTFQDNDGGFFMAHLEGDHGLSLDYTYGTPRPLDDQDGLDLKAVRSAQRARDASTKRHTRAYHAEQRKAAAAKARRSAIAKKGWATRRKGKRREPKTIEVVDGGTEDIPRRIPNPDYKAPKRKASRRTK